MRSAIAQFIPKPLKAPLRVIRDRSLLPYQYVMYQFDLSMRGGDQLLPPPWLHSVGSPNFVQVGDEFLRHFREIGELKPNDQVLDVGSGTGRMARPLVTYLKDGGSYHGLDIVARSINWCQKTYSPKNHNFSFHFADVYNEKYNPEGKYRADGYRFPFEDASFDFVFLVSVFTHMLPLGMENYLSETARVLRDGGRCLITYFLLNRHSQERISEGVSRQTLIHELDGCHVEDREVPEAAVGYNETRIRELYNDCGFGIAEPIHFGRWCNLESGLSYQDLVLATKTRVLGEEADTNL